MESKNITIRNIEKKDNPLLASVVRNTLSEFGANHPGTVYYDSTTDSLFEIFQEAKAHYFIAELDEQFVGGAGIFPTSGLQDGTCELVKMYLLPEARGIGLGKDLIARCIEKARENGFNRIYLESMPELSKALKVYEKFGFEYLSGPMGNSGHFGCSLWMLKELY